VNPFTPAADPEEAGFELYDLRVEVVGPPGQTEVACPDPHCPTRFRITRTGRRHFRRSDTTAVALPEPGRL
jgi:hypothetical protein